MTEPTDPVTPISHAAGTLALAGLTILAITVLAFVHIPVPPVLSEIAVGLTGGGLALAKATQ